MRIFLALCATLATSAAAASTGCSGQQSKWCDHLKLPGCTSSDELSAEDCQAWLQLWDNTDGDGWTYCNDYYKNDPCSCFYQLDDYGIMCQNKRIVYLNLGPPTGNNMKPPTDAPPTDALCSPTLRHFSLFFKNLPVVLLACRS